MPTQMGIHDLACKAAPFSKYARSAETHAANIRRRTLESNSGTDGTITAEAIQGPGPENLASVLQRLFIRIRRSCDHGGVRCLRFAPWAVGRGVCSLRWISCEHRNIITCLHGVVGFGIMIL